MNYISSSLNPIIKKINSLKKKIVVGAKIEVMIEGERLVNDAVRYGASISAVVVRENYEGSIPDAEKTYVVKASVFDKLAETVTPQGIIAIASIKCGTIDLENPCGAIIVCDNVRDPGNMGTIIRTAHSVGAAGVLLSRGCVNPYNLKALRAAMGSTFAVNIMFFESYEEILKIKNSGFAFCCGLLSDESTDLFDTDLKGRIAFVVGNEGNGVGPEMAKLCDKKVIIPMPGGTESLNAAVSAAVMLYEHLRQNR